MKNVSTKTKHPAGVVAADGTGWRYVYAVLGLFLIASGLMRLYEVVSGGHGDEASAMPTLALGEAEFFGGLWLFSERYPGWTRLWAASAFAGLAGSDLLQAIDG